MTPDHGWCPYTLRKYGACRRLMVRVCGGPTLRAHLCEAAAAHCDPNEASCWLAVYRIIPIRLKSKPTDPPQAPQGLDLFSWSLVTTRLVRPTVDTCGKDE